MDRNNYQASVANLLTITPNSGPRPARQAVETADYLQLEQLTWPVYVRAKQAAVAC